MLQNGRWMLASHLKKRALLTAVNMFAGMSIFFFGYDQGVMGGVNISNDYINVMNLGYVDDDGTIVVTRSFVQGGIVCVFYLGTLVGCLAGGAVGDKYGRIKTIAIGAAVAIIGASFQCSAQGIDWMIVSRVVTGFGTGMLNAIVPTYAGEVADYTSRGQFIALEFTLNIFGVVVAYWLGYGVSFVHDGESPLRWRFPIGFQIIPLIGLLAACWFFPESPRWLCKVGRNDEAFFILQCLRGGTSGDGGVAAIELRDIQNVVDMEKHEEHNITYFSMFFGTGRGSLHITRRTHLCIWLQIMQSWTGISGVTMYGPTIFTIAGFTAHKAQWLSGLNNVLYMLSTFICVLTLDRIGRRKTLYWGSVAQGIAMFLVGGLSAEGLNATTEGRSSVAKAYGAAAAAMVILYTFVFGATWLTVPWLYPAEIFPVRCRAMGNSWGVVGWSIGCATLTLLLPEMVKGINNNMMYIFGGVNFVTIPIVWALYPESNQRTLEEMDFLFSSPEPWAWEAEKAFKLAREQGPPIGRGTSIVLNLSRRTSTEAKCGLHVDNIDETKV
ncbi:MFS-type transporter oryC [Exophiala dermatitidis]|uniref:MFS transporter, SP family, arabinose:H+ symporter n=1 Tax=Exophiala dermatitidis (strain ATCC 34100 / CBS 525.76 / NIH/UT8656) TaxID=858893 RepID=H6C2N4_EXODN|nr:MFS transporter, SP family, arabinose:H+ symporter [Exophiala dermatitidis NIH/UT8656]EHY57952.1 MFS transporter, SP family, arabinose:H+ symporter [Exophiala dermatitidis NIH/UT8656]